MNKAHLKAQAARHIVTAKEHAIADAMNTLPRRTRLYVRVLLRWRDSRIWQPAFLGNQASRIVKRTYVAYDAELDRIERSLPRRYRRALRGAAMEPSVKG